MQGMPSGMLLQHTCKPYMTLIHDTASWLCGHQLPENGSNTYGLAVRHAAGRLLQSWITRHLANKTRDMSILVLH
jgi:hypothetical protein